MNRDRKILAKDKVDPIWSAMREQAEDVARSEPELADLCYTASVGRSHCACRRAFVVTSREPLVRAAEGVAEPRNRRAEISIR